MRTIIGIMGVVTLSLAAAATGEVRQWWKYESERIGIRFVYPAHWSAREAKEGDTSFRVVVGPRGEHPPLEVSVGPATGAKEYDSWAKVMAADRMSKITIVEVAGREARQLSYYVYKSGYRRSVRLVHRGRLVTFDCDLEIVPEGEEACDRLLKSFRFVKHEP